MYTGPKIDDQEILELLPLDLCDFLRRCNGYVAFHGGLHIRGACLNPSWHSLRYWWLGAGALHRLFPSVDESDVPFGEDALGDQYLLRAGVVHRLSAESGEERIRFLAHVASQVGGVLDGAKVRFRVEE